MQIEYQSSVNIVVWLFTPTLTRGPSPLKSIPASLCAEVLVLVLARCAVGGGGGATAAGRAEAEGQHRMAEGSCRGSNPAAAGRNFASIWTGTL
jgi:hypothetical protein